MKEILLSKIDRFDLKRHSKYEVIEKIQRVRVFKGVFVYANF